MFIFIQYVSIFNWPREDSNERLRILQEENDILMNQQVQNQQLNSDLQNDLEDQRHLGNNYMLIYI
jgi:hypothetical protein